MINDGGRTHETTREQTTSHKSTGCVYCTIFYPVLNAIDLQFYCLQIIEILTNYCLISVD